MLSSFGFRSRSAGATAAAGALMGFACLALSSCGSDGGESGKIKLEEREFRFSFYCNSEVVLSTSPDDFCAQLKARFKNSADSYCESSARTQFAAHCPNSAW